MAKKTKEVEKEKDSYGSVEEGLAMLIEMETNELQAIIKMRDTLTDMCVNKKNTLILFGKMTGLDTSLLESLKVD